MEKFPTQEIDDIMSRVPTMATEEAEETVKSYNLDIQTRVKTIQAIQKRKYEISDIKLVKTVVNDPTIPQDINLDSTDGLLRALQQQIGLIVAESQVIEAIRRRALPIDSQLFSPKPFSAESGPKLDDSIVVVLSAVLGSVFLILLGILLYVSYKRRAKLIKPANMKKQAPNSMIRNFLQIEKKNSEYSDENEEVGSITTLSKKGSFTLATSDAFTTRNYY